MASKVILGDITFTPGPRRKIRINNPRSIARYDIPGGAPVYQDMGEDETTLAWDGVLAGEEAYRTAVKIESLKDAGQAVQLVVSDFPELSKRVRIRSFAWDVVRQDWVEYSIELVAEVPQPKVSQVTVSGTGSRVVTRGLPSARSPAPGKVHTVKQGDTLWAMAIKYLGNGNRWREIAKANKIMDPRSLRIGQKITIPG